MAVDLFANAANTTLAAGISAGAVTLTVASSTPFPAVTTAAATQFRVIIDSELFIVTNVSGTTWTVTPGAEGTTQAAHAISAPVTAVLTAGSLTAKTAGNASLNGKLTSTHYIIQGDDGGSSTAAFSGGFMRAMPIYVSEPTTIDRLCLQVTAAVASSTIRLGIFDDVGGVPTNLIIDAGTADSSTVGVKELTISATTLPPGRSWLAACGQGSGSPSATSPSQYSFMGTLRSRSSVTVGAGQMGYYNTAGAITAAFPSTYGAATLATGTQLALIWVREA